MTDTQNTKLWDQLKRVPKEHLKGFKRAGGFSGTAIKPMWSFHRMTEMFGPCGKGWGIEKPDFQLVPAGDEIMVYSTVAVWYYPDGHKEGTAPEYLWGVGGDKVRTIGDKGARNDDEAFKKAYTDALTNALKLLGVGADVHMGLWDGNKYVDDKPEEKPAPVTGTLDASKAENRERFDTLVKQVRDAASQRALREWYDKNRDEINKLPSDWVDTFRVEYSDKLSELKGKAAA